MFIRLLFLLMSVVQWHYNLEEAEKIAQADHKFILLNFSGSDWCGPCIRMHKEIFENPDFASFADTALVMLNADFPRSKKNQLSAKQQEANNAMADKYNAQGQFPYTVLLNANGKMIKSWDGLPNEKPAAFAATVKSFIDASKVSR